MTGLTVGDGFKFGCGFFLAAFIVWLVMVIVGGILMAIFGTALTALLQGFNLNTTGLILPLLSLI